MKEKREKRLEKEISKLVYELLTTRIKNPNITEMFSVTGAKVTSDLEIAYVYVSVFSKDKEKSERTFKAICDSAFDLRKLLAHEMRIRTVPKIIFQKDTSFEYGEKIERIISGFTYGEDDDDN